MFDSKTFTPVIFLIVAGIVFYGGVWQQISAVQTLRMQISNADIALKQARGGNIEQNKLVDAWQNLDSALKDRVNLGVPIQSDLSDLLSLLNNTVTDSGLLLENISPLETAPPASVPAPSSAASANSAPVARPSQSILLSVRARGDYPSMKVFLQSVQKEERIMDLQSITISPFLAQGTQSSASAGQTNNAFEMNVVVKAYYGQ